MLVERGHRNIYIPIIEPEANPAAFANDACFGRADPADDAGTYDELDAEHNALEQIPCLTRECVTPRHATPRATHATPASQLHVPFGVSWVSTPSLPLNFITPPLS